MELRHICRSAASKALLPLHTHTQATPDHLQELPPGGIQSPLRHPGHPLGRTALLGIAEKLGCNKCARGNIATAFPVYHKHRKSSNDLPAGYMAWYLSTHVNTTTCSHILTP